MLVCTTFLETEEKGKKSIIEIMNENSILVLKTTRQIVTDIRISR